MNWTADFPILAADENGKRLVYLDSAATTQHPTQVLNAVVNYYNKENANPHRGVYELAMRATDAHEGARHTVAQFFNAEDDEIVFTQNTTESLNLVAYSYGMNFLHEGDEIVISVAEHHSNMVPWQRVAKATGAKLVYMYPGENGRLTTEELDKKITSKTKVVAVAMVSNVLGLRAPVEEIVKRAHAVGAVVVLDCAQSAPHTPVDVKKLDVDFAACSAHKLYAPMGVGALYARAGLLEKMPPFMSGGDMIGAVHESGATWADGPRKFEAGTRNVGGEGGFANRTPEATMEGLNKFGVTTVVGCLGTDGIGRDMCALVAKTKGLREQGMSAWCYTGSYQVPVRTLTDGITKDIMMIEEIIGTGEIAISDHRSSQPTFEEFARLAADTRLGGVLSGKAGVINVHLGDGARCMELIERVISETEIPASQFLPTHVNRNEKLFQKAIEYAVKGGAVDFTGNEEIDYWETVCDEVRVCKGIRRMLDAGVNPKHITISSDGQGSLPIFNEKGEFLRMGMGQSSCLLKEVKECVEKAGIPLETAISTITANPAEILSLKGKGKIQEGFDADLCVLDQGLEIQEVIARGKSVYRK